MVFLGCAANALTMGALAVLSLRRARKAATTAAAVMGRDDDDDGGGSSHPRRSQRRRRREQRGLGSNAYLCLWSLGFLFPLLFVASALLPAAYFGFTSETIYLNARAPIAETVEQVSI